MKYLGWPSIVVLLILIGITLGLIVLIGKGAYKSIKQSEFVRNNCTKTEYTYIKRGMVETIYDCEGVK